MTKEDSVFTRIINGELPSHKIYEDDRTIAILDITPMVPGHTLVVSKEQVDHLWDLDEKDYQAMWATAKKVADKMRKELGCERVGTIVEGIEVPHAHIKMIPLDSLFSEIFRHFDENEGHEHHDHLDLMAQKLKIN